MALQEPTSPSGQADDNAGLGSSRQAKDGLVVEQVFSEPGVHPFEQIEWEKRTARIVDDKGNTIFEQEDAEVPATWSQLATALSACSCWGESSMGKER